MLYQQDQTKLNSKFIKDNRNNQTLKKLLNEDYAIHKMLEKKLESKVNKG